MSAPAPAKAEGRLPPWTLGLPRDESEIEATQRTRKRLAVERALRSKLLAPRVAGIRLDRLDDPDEWGKIPVLTKDELRKLPTAAFYADFCIAPIGASRELWRSGGATGKPLFYPRSSEDLDYNLGVAFRRIWPCIGARPGDVVHVSFPLGIHPVGQLTPRSAQMEGLATIWAGAGTTTPTAVQLELIRELEPTILAAMPSYALHLANVAEAQGIDLASSSVRKLLVSAEPLTAAKRTKLERAWGAKVYNSFGMTEGAMTTVERDGVDGMVAWTDLFYLEVVDSANGKPVAPGEQGLLVMTPLWSNTITPFLRWLTGDVVRLAPQRRTDDPFSIFPVLLGLIGGALGSQLPEFSQQYRQRLGGALGEIERIVTEFDRDATGSGLSRDQALAQYATANNEFLNAQGKSVTSTLARRDKLQKQSEAIEQAPPLMRPFEVMRSPDPSGRITPI